MSKKSMHDDEGKIKIGALITLAVVVLFPFLIPFALVLAFIILPLISKNASKAETKKWQEDNRPTFNGGILYAYHVPEQDWIKIGVTQYSAWNRMQDYCEKYYLKPAGGSLKTFNIPEHVNAGKVEEFVHNFIKQHGHKPQHDIKALELFQLNGKNYNSVLGTVQTGFKIATT